MDRANLIAEGEDAVIIACGEMVPYAVKAQKALAAEGFCVGVIDMYCLKPIDENAVVQAASKR